VKHDRITEALERAQAQGMALGDGGLRTPRGTPTPLAPVARQPEFVRGSPGGTSFVYTRTRVARVPQEWLIYSRVAVPGAEPAFVDAVKLVRTQIVQRMREQGWRTLAVVSPSEGEGKTFMAVNIAVSIAAEYDQTVLLVDANLRRPSIHEYFGLPAEPGLANFLVERVAVDSILINPGIDRLVIMPGGTPQLRSAELLGSHVMTTLMADIRSRYSDRIVVIDLPPLLRSADALSFSPLADALVMVVEDNHSQREDVLRAQQLLSGANLLGVVLNKSRETRRDSAHRPTGLFGRLFHRG
jgi:protein-tyrosine kinase